MNMKRTGWRSWLPVAAVLMLAGCASVEPVKPWEKGTLARPEMGFDGDRVDNAYGEHIYTSREAGRADVGVGGGGCGCN